MQILDWLQDSALQRRKEAAFILFMIDEAKRLAEHLLEHRHASEQPAFQAQK